MNLKFILHKTRHDLHSSLSALEERMNKYDFAGEQEKQENLKCLNKTKNNGRRNPDLDGEFLLSCNLY